MWSVVVVLAGVGAAPVVHADSGEWTDPDGDGIYAPPAHDTTNEWTDDGDWATDGGEWTDPDGDGIYAPPTHDTTNEWSHDGDWAPDGGEGTDPDGDGIYAPPTHASPTAGAEPAAGEWTAQSADVVITDVAVADTGANTSSGSANDGATGASPATISTGAADAIGSDDRTTLDQQATVDLADEATADVLQMAIVFNIGSAQASSGGNAATGGSTGTAGAVSTGDATAVGNDGAVVVLQASAANSSGAPDGSEQEAITLRIGIAVANTGANGATGSGAPGGAATTGDASAIGNDATTDIVQLTVVTGSGTSQLSVDQRAVVLNIGLALANTGGNGSPMTSAISVAANDFAASPDEAHAATLMTLLLPTLLASTGNGPAVSSGDATAIGNRAITSIDQSANATASGDGTVTIDQQAVVTNMGIAVANTGNNGSGVASGSAMDPATADAVASIAAFVGSLMHDLQRWDGSGELLGRGLTLDVGGRDIVLDSRLAGQLLTGDPTTPEGGRTIRQLSAIINLGIAVVDSGGNESTAPLVMIEPTAQAGTVSISTGDATAVNRSTVVVCQRDDRPDAVCPDAPAAAGAVDEPMSVGGVPAGVAPMALSAGTTAAGAAASRAATPDGDGQGVLPATGGDPTVLATWAAALLAAGLVASRTAAFRRDRQDGRP